MKTSYTVNYLKIYLWQGISLIFNFISMFIVIPYLTSEPTIYGIYTVCISISIFLAYADLGFLSAGQKYAAEYFAIGELNKEIRVIGFSNFFLLIFLIIFSLIFILLGFHPELLIKGLIQGKQTSIASSLLFILAIFTPVTLLQRMLQMIFGIRLEDYIPQRINIVANIFKIISVLYFFKNGNYNIVGYFLFMQVINLFAAIFTLIIARKRYHYNFKMLLRSISFNNNVFAKTKGLAFTSLYLTVTWILYYELDPTVIGKFCGAKQVSFFAIGLTMMSFFRSIQGILFSPFSSRFNHFIGLNDEEGLKSFVKFVTILMMPVIVIPTIAVVLMDRHLILSWVGPEFTESISISRYLVLCNVFSFITYPAALLLMAKERIKEMYFVSSFLPFIYWVGILITYSSLGLLSFALFKFIAISISSIVYYFLIIEYLGISIVSSIKLYIKPIIFPLLFLFLVSFYCGDYLPVSKSKYNLFITAISTGLFIIISFGLLIITSKYYKQQLFRFFNFKVFSPSK